MCVCVEGGVFIWVWFVEEYHERMGSFLGRYLIQDQRWGEYFFRDIDSFFFLVCVCVCVRGGAYH